MAQSAWIQHVLAVKKAKGISFKQALKVAAKTYKKTGVSSKKSKRKTRKVKKGKKGKRCRRR